jgi:hypothetical protein
MVGDHDLSTIEGKGSYSEFVSTIYMASLRAKSQEIHQWVIRLDGKPFSDSLCQTCYSSNTHLRLVCFIHTFDAPLSFVAGLLNLDMPWFKE